MDSFCIKQKAGRETENRGRKALYATPNEMAERIQLRKRGLTLQPFPPNLRLTRHMHGRSRYIGTLALLLSVIFVGAQFHFCTDRTATPTASHLCPICSTAGSAVATRSPGIPIVPATNRFEIVPAVVSISLPFKRATSWRAPPTV